MLLSQTPASAPNSARDREDIEPENGLWTWRVEYVLNPNWFGRREDPDTDFIAEVRLMNLDSSFLESPLTQGVFGRWFGFV